MSDHAWRRDALGGSDAAALVGVDPFKTAGDVFCEKTGRVPLVEEEAGGVNARALGSALEPVLLDAVEHRLRRPLARQVWYRHPSAPMACSVDGIALDAPALLVDAKTAGLLGPLSPLLAAYGEDGSDEVPESVTVQIHHSLAVLDAQPDLPRIEEAWIPALLGGRGFRCYRIRRDDRLVRELVTLEAEWWERHVVGDRCPPDDPPSLPTLRALRRRAEIPVRALDEVLVGEWLHAKQVKAQAEKLEETCRRFVLTDLGDGEVGECVHGRVTYYAHERTAPACKRCGHREAPVEVRTLRHKAAPAPGARKVA
jgi:predicted phage-related endonuclease